MEPIYKKPAVQYGVLAAGGLFLLGYVLYLSSSGGSGPSPEELTKTALTHSDASQREQAAAALAAHPAASLEQLRQVWHDSSDIPVRAAVVIALGTRRDWASMPELMAALDDPSPLLRGRSAQAINDIVGQDFHFRANDSPEDRAKVVADIESKWETAHAAFLIKQKFTASGTKPEIWKETMKKHNRPIE